MIYFDKVYKLAHTNEIPNPLCVIENEVWSEFCFLKIGTDYEVTDKGIVDLRQTPEYKEKELKKAQTDKHAENTQKAKQSIENGFVIFKDAQFETNDGTATNLDNKRKLCIIRGDAYAVWLSKDDKIVELIINEESPLEDDFVQIGFLVEEFKNTVWTTKYLTFKAQIENAQTVEEVRSIEITYD